MDSRAIGLKMCQLRERQGLTMAQLAKMISITQAQISRLENGRQGFRSKTLIKIAKALGVKPIYFFLDDAPVAAGGGKGAAAGGVPIDSKLALALRDGAFRGFMDRMAEVYHTNPRAFSDFCQALEGLIKALGRV